MTRSTRTYLFVALFLCGILAIAQPAYAHDAEDHNAELEKILFNGKNPGNDDAVRALEDAAYLCVDFCGMNGKGVTCLESLKNYGVSGLPERADDIDMPGGQYHRQYTHRGWDDQIKYFNGNAEQEDHWAKRKDLLLNTSYKVFGYAPPPDFLSWTSLSNKDMEKKYESFCALIYYVHVLGDYVEDVGSDYLAKDNLDKFNGVSNGRKIAFARPHPNDDNIDIFYEFDQHLKVLFANQASTIVYKQLMSDLNTLAGKARRLSGSTGGINDLEKLEEAKMYVNELMDILSGSGSHANRVHELLAGEEFFCKAFPGLKGTARPKGWLEGLIERVGLVA